MRSHILRGDVWTDCTHYLPAGVNAQVGQQLYERFQLVLEETHLWLLKCSMVILLGWCHYRTPLQQARQVHRYPRMELGLRELTVGLHLQGGLEEGVPHRHRTHQGG